MAPYSFGSTPVHGSAVRLWSGTAGACTERAQNLVPLLLLLLLLPPPPTGQKDWILAVDPDGSPRSTSPPRRVSGDAPAVAISTPPRRFVERVPARGHQVTSRTAPLSAAPLEPGLLRIGRAPYLAARPPPLTRCDWSSRLQGDSLTQHPWLPRIMNGPRVIMGFDPVQGPTLLSIPTVAASVDAQWHSIWCSSADSAACQHRRLHLASGHRTSVKRSRGTRPTAHCNYDTSGYGCTEPPVITPASSEEGYLATSRPTDPRSQHARYLPVHRSTTTSRTVLVCVRPFFPSKEKLDVARVEIQSRQPPTWPVVADGRRCDGRTQRLRLTQAFLHILFRVKHESRSSSGRRGGRGPMIHRICQVRDDNMVDTPYTILIRYDLLPWMTAFHR